MIKAKKKFGQNFLKDSYYCERIVLAMPEDYDIVEIGPGLGDLTRRLVAKKEVSAYEIDTDLVSYLREEFKDEIAKGQLRLIVGDVMENWKEALNPRPYAIVANLPYYVATAIILRAMQDSLCRSIVVMVQKEVAQKFCAKTGESAYCALSVLASFKGKAELLFDVPPESFDPIPKVVSAVMRLTKDENFMWDEGFSQFLARAFHAPRKTLMKNLSESYSKEILIPLWNEWNFSLTVRPHELSPSLFADLYARLK